MMPIFDSSQATRRVKTLATKIGSGKTPPGGSETYTDDGVLFLRSQNIHFDGLRLDDVAHIDISVHSDMRSTRVFENDVLLNITGASLGRVSRVPRGVGEANVNQHVCIIRPGSEVESRFLTYAMSAQTTQEQISSLQVGGNRDGLNFEQVGNIELTFWRLEEQRRIADFLDTETARIDRLRSAKAKQLTLLQERWESGIHNALTRDGAEMVELRRMGTRVTTGPFGTVFNAAEYTDDGIPMINPLHIKNGEIIPDRLHSVLQTTADRLSRHRLRKGDLVVGRKGDLGRAAIVRSHQDGWVCGSDCIALHPSLDRIRPMFLAYAMRSQFIRTQLLSRSLAATMPSLNEGNLLSLRIPNIPQERQDQFIDQMHSAHAWTTRTSSAMHTQLALLAERRQALITAAVTGQIDVSTASGRGIDPT